MPFPCHVVPLKLCLSHLIYTVWPCLLVPCHDLAILKAISQGHGTARHGHGMTCVKEHRPSRDGMWATCPPSAFYGYGAEFHEVCYRKYTNPLNCRISSSDISGYPADFHEGHGTVGKWQGRGMARVNWKWQGMSWERHGMCELAFTLFPSMCWFETTELASTCPFPFNI
jgi:hypothetical protein